QQRWQVRAYGATEEQVQECITEYLRRKRPFTIVTDMMMSAWREANDGLTADAVQTLNRVKLAIDRFYADPSDRGFFERPAGRAYSILSDAQELLGMGDIRRAQMCIDDSVAFITQQERQ
ncbi:MAG: hypothetical protein KGR21_09725, partial [Proteobacteria bacterium]|nr:hypothetical protein [Pseudomonadota bacterium]